MWRLLSFMLLSQALAACIGTVAGGGNLSALATYAELGNIGAVAAAPEGVYVASASNAIVYLLTGNNLFAPVAGKKTNAAL
jgi:hypothetical protein